MKKQLYYWIKENETAEWEPAFFDGSSYSTFINGEAKTRLPEEFFAIDPTPFFRHLEPAERLAIARRMLQMVSNLFLMPIDCGASLNKDAQMTIVVMATDWSKRPDAKIIDKVFKQMLSLWRNGTDHDQPIATIAFFLSDAENISVAMQEANYFDKFQLLPAN